MRKITAILFLLLIANLFTACSNQEKEETIVTKSEKTFKIGAIPDQNAAELSRSMDEVATYLSSKTGLKVEYVPSVDYAALVTAFERGEIQLGWFGGLTGVQARNLVPDAEAIAQRPRDEDFHTVFIAQKELGLTSLEEIRGKSFTFGSESSTSGHLMARYYLMEAGIDADKDFSGVPNYSGSHDKTYKLVESGTFQTGALNEAVWEAAVEQNLVDTNKVEVFYTTPSYYDYNWTINVVEEFGSDTKKNVTEALLTMSSDQQQVMQLFQTDKFIPTKNENYRAIEEVASKLGIIK